MTYALIILSVAFAVMTVRCWELKRENEALRSINNAQGRELHREDDAILDAEELA